MVELKQLYLKLCIFGKHTPSSALWVGVKFSPVQQAMKLYGALEVQLHSFLASAVVGVHREGVLLCPLERTKGGHQS
jgi:hypothetical protein